MNTTLTPGEPADPTPSSSAHRANGLHAIQQSAPDLGHAIALSIGLALALEALLVLIAVAFAEIHGPIPFLVDGAQKLAWSVLVCGALVVGIAATRAAPMVAGVVGLFAAPVASLLARGVVEGAHALAITPTAPGGLSPFVLAGIKAVEYGFLGVAAGLLAGRARGGKVAHFLLGLVAGLLFGGVVLALSMPLPKPVTAPVMRWSVNEVLFPIGCALILWATAEVEASRRAP
jgi:hypothetical protein